MAFSSKQYRLIRFLKKHGFQREGVYVDFHDYQLSYEGPKWIESYLPFLTPFYSEITVLNLYDPDPPYPPLQDHDMQRFENLDSLEKIVLSSQVLTDETVKSFSTCKNLRNVELAGKGFTGTSLEYLKLCPKLAFLELAEVSMTGTDMKHLSDMKNLIHLTLIDDDRIDIRGFEAVGGCKKLMSLCIVNCPVDGTIFKYLRPCTELDNIVANRLSLTSDDLQPLLLLPKLEWLQLDATAIDDRGLEILSKIPTLKEICINACDRITDAGLSYLQNHPGLESIQLDNCPGITDKGLEYLGKIKTLDHLYVRGNLQITDACLEYLTGLDNLWYFIFEGSSITKKGIGILKDLPCFPDLTYQFEE